MTKFVVGGWFVVIVGKRGCCLLHRKIEEEEERVGEGGGHSLGHKLNITDGFISNYAYKNEMLSYLLALVFSFLIFQL